MRDGFLNILKPPGMTSSNVVSEVRRLLHEKKAGHLGTLDPGASGVLPVSLGRANRLFDLLVDKDKTYVFEVQFGIGTDTLDSYGRCVAKCACSVSESDLSAVLPRFLGEQTQLAPAFSAVKVGGKKLYDLARSGEEIPERARTVRIDSIAILSHGAGNRFLLRAQCSRGTYVRVLAEDLGRALGVPACVTLLIRTASGPFAIKDAVSLSELERMPSVERRQREILPAEKVLSFLPELILPENRRKAAVSGLPTDGIPCQDGIYRLYAPDFLGVAHVSGGKVCLQNHLYQH